MALIVEDGSIVSGANTFASVADLDAYAALRGLTLPATSPEKEILLIKAMDYIEAQEQRFKGYRVNNVQEVSWPRVQVTLYYTERYYRNGYENISHGGYFPDDAIPSVLIKAQCQLAIDVQTVDLMPTITPDSRSVRREKIGPIETEYFGSGEQLNAPIMAKAEALLAPLCSTAMFGLTLGHA